MDPTVGGGGIIFTEVMALSNDFSLSRKLPFSCSKIFFIILHECDDRLRELHIQHFRTVHVTVWRLITLSITFDKVMPIAYNYVCYYREYQVLVV